MSLSRTFTRRKPMGTDSRFRQGVNTAEQWHRARNEAIRQEKALAAMNPLNYGWKKLYWHTEAEQWVYGLQGIKMMYLEKTDEWQIEVNGRTMFKRGHMLDITEYVLSKVAA